MVSARRAVQIHHPDLTISTIRLIVKRARRGW
jgi:hypothetical protein